MYNIAPTLLTAEVVKSSAAPQLYIGIKQPVPFATLRASSDGFRGRLRARFVPDSPGDGLAVTLGDQGEDSVEVLPPGGGGAVERGITIFAQPAGNSLSKAGKKITGRIEIEAVTADPYDPNSVVRLGEADAAPGRVKQEAVEFEVRACSIRALWKGADCLALPTDGARFLVGSADSTLKTAAATPALSLELVGAENLPDEVADKLVTAKATSPAGLIQSVQFDVTGKEPQDHVTLRDLRDGKVRGLVIKASPDKADDKPMREGQITVEVADLGTSLSLPVKMRVPAGGNDLLYIVLAVLAVIVLLVVLKKFRGPKDRHEPVPEYGDESAGADGGSLLDAGHAHAPPVAVAASPGARSGTAARTAPDIEAAGGPGGPGGHATGGGVVESPPPAPPEPWDDPDGSLLGYAARVRARQKEMAAVGPAVRRPGPQFEEGKAMSCTEMLSAGGPGLVPAAGAALAAWSPERLALILTLALALITIGVIVLSLQAFDKGIRNEKMPSKVRSQLYGRVMGWFLLAGLIAGAIWYFDEFLFERVSRVSF